MKINKRYLKKISATFFCILIVALSVTASVQALSLDDIYTPEIYDPATTIDDSVPPVSISTYTYILSDNRPVEVQYSFPNAPDYSDLTVVIVMPGLTRDPNGSYMRSFSYLSRVENICVITPKFAQEYFPTAEYQRINISAATPYEEWTFNKLDLVFEDFIRRFDLQVSKYILYGHSAGGQFAHRTGIFSRSDYLDYVISASSGSFTFLDENEYYSSGIKNILDYKSNILFNLSNRKVYILTGNKDNDPNASDFTPSEQGSTRHEKALNFYKSTLTYAVQNRVYYNWETLIMDGVDHSSSQTIPYVLDIIMGKYQSKTVHINNRINDYYYSNTTTFTGGAADWAKPELAEAFVLGVVPDSVSQAGWTHPTSRITAAEAIVLIIEKVSGKTIDQIAAEKGWNLSENLFIDTSNKSATFLKYANITSGTGNNEYSPNADYTRAQIVTMIGRTAEVFFGVSAHGINTFSDVPDWASPYVGYAAEKGITSGVGGNVFDSNGILQNQQTAVFLTRAYKVWKDL